MPLDELPAWARELIESARVARLGLLDESDLPRVLPVTFAEWDGGLWSAIDQKPKSAAEPARVRRLRRRPQAALLIDLYHDDWSLLAWVELRGHVAVFELEDAREALDALVARYEQYRGEPPSGPFLRLTPERVSCWRSSDAS